MARLSALLFVVGGALALPAVASTPISEDAGVKTTYAMVDCLMPKSANILRQMLAYPPRTKQQGDLFVKTKPSFCVSGKYDPKIDTTKGFVIPDSYVRGAVAEAVLKADFSSIGVSTGQKPARIFAAMTPDAMANDKLSDRTVTDLAILTTLECATRAAPVPTFAVFGTQIRTPEEKAALSALSPAISSCLVQDQQFTMKPSMMRGYLAEAAYRVSVETSTKPQVVS